MIPLHSSELKLLANCFSFTKGVAGKGSSSLIEMCPKLHLGLWVHPPSFTALQWGGCGCGCRSADIPVALRALLPSSSANKTHACHLRQHQPWLPLPSHPITFVVEFRLIIVQEWFPVMCLSGRYKNEGQFLLSFSHTTLSRSGCGFSFVFVFVFVLFWFFECKQPNKTLPFFPAKTEFPKWSLLSAVDGKRSFVS